ncbi:ubiquinone/menaquinone biosynthesis methyltransferase [Tropheryma whipplei]|uniref:ubiquinone/menaquinone biosynthesis methyltransferase n=1 Tax=Tropheryma whipplei TaxID=2039 RepID=UPI001F4CCC95|nr:ubiquinone/menaquinone biosynthesis methyltransferase [Tropheryma whipplei]
MVIHGKHTAEIRKMFNRVAQAYDRTNLVLSFLQDAHWRRAACKMLGVTAGEEVLDVGAGTGASTRTVVRTGAAVTGIDISPRMLQIARNRCKRFQNITWRLTNGDLPFPDKSFDAILMVFCLRNVSNIQGFLCDAARVLKPGGRLVVCEFSHPRRFVAPFYRLYLRYVLPRLAKLISSDPAAYEYLTESIEDWYEVDELAFMLEQCGFQNTSWKRLSFGAVALHRALRGPE